MAFEAVFISPNSYTSYHDNDVYTPFSFIISLILYPIFIFIFHGFFQRFFDDFLGFPSGEIDAGPRSAGVAQLRGGEGTKALVVGDVWGFP